MILGERTRKLYLVFVVFGWLYVNGRGLVSSSSSVGPLRPSGSSGTMNRSPTKEYIRSLKPQVNTH